MIQLSCKGVRACAACVSYSTTAHKTVGIVHGALHEKLSGPLVREIIAYCLQYRTSFLNLVRLLMESSIQFLPVHKQTAL